MRARPSLARAWTLLRRSLVGWWKGDSLQLGAALAYYTVFSLAPLLTLSIAIAGLFAGTEAAREAVLVGIRDLVGPEGARSVGDMLASASVDRSASWAATAISVGTILLGASGAFGQLQRALNRIWEVEPPPGGVLRVLRARLLSFGTVLIVGFLLLVSLVIAAGVAALDRMLDDSLPVLQPLAAFAQFAASLGIATLLFAAIFKLLPDRSIAWSDVWVGAFATAVLFEFGKSAIGAYLGNVGVASAFGAAGSLVVLLLWIYYASQIVFLGAEFTQVWSQRSERSEAGSGTGFQARS